MSTRFLTADNNCTIGVSDCGTGTNCPTYQYWDNINYYQPTYTIPMPAYIPMPVIIPATWITPVVVAKEERMEERMFIYEVIAVDKKECKILTSQTVIAKDRQSAMLELDLTPEMKVKNKKGEIEFIFIEKGAFNKIEKKEK
jgi:hypothetical protein